MGKHADFAGCLTELFRDIGVAIEQNEASLISGLGPGALEATALALFRWAACEGGAMHTGLRAKRCVERAFLAWVQAGGRVGDACAPAVHAGERGGRCVVTGIVPGDHSAPWGA